MGAVLADLPTLGWCKKDPISKGLPLLCIVVSHPCLYEEAFCGLYRYSFKTETEPTKRRVRAMACPAVLLRAGAGKC